VSATRLIVNADDFGMSPGVNAGVLRAFDAGIVTSASLMVHGTAAAAAAAAAARHGLALGLHFELADWELVDDEWVCRLERAPANDAAAVAAELTCQLERFEAVSGRRPTHIDSHQHVHRHEPARTVVRKAAARLGIPVRHYGPVRYCGSFYGHGRKGEPYPDALSAHALAEIVASLPPDTTTELACHPAAVLDVESGYAEERLVELEALCDPRVRAAVACAGVTLCNFMAVQP
jgi:chitin disaccharide deacetylase